jgi:hypothetical protein
MRSVRLRSPRPVLEPLVVAGTVLLTCRWSAALEVAPVLGVFHGSLGLVLAAVALGVAAAHAGLGDVLRRARLLDSRFRPAALGVGSALVLSLVGLHYAGRLRVSGDEPHYLLMTQSLLREGDLDLRDNFGRGDFLEYLPAMPAPHYGAPRKDGRPFPAHSVGLPLLLAPVYAVAGRLGGVLFMAICAAALAIESMWLAQRVLGGRSAWPWLVALGPPVAFYAFHLYTEIPSALALATVLRLLVSGPGRAGAAVAALLACFLPWLHVKMAPAAAALGLIACVRLRGSPRGVFLGVAAAGALIYAGYFEWVFGSPTPLALYGGGSPRDVIASGAPRALAGLLLDRSFGLLGCAPVYLLALAGLSALTRRLRDHWPYLLILVAVVLPVLGWRMWWGGQCPPARFLVPAVPVLALAAAARLQASPTGLARWRFTLASLTAGLFAFMVARPEAMLLLNRGDRPTRVWDALSEPGGVQIGSYLPSLTIVSPGQGRLAVLWLLALLLTLGLDRLARRRPAVDRLFSGLTFPVALLLLVGWVVDLAGR